VNLTAERIQTVEKGDGREAVESLLRRSYMQEPMQLTLRAKMDSWNGEPRTNVTCIDARPVSRGEGGRAMLREISQMLAAKACF